MKVSEISIYICLQIVLALKMCIWSKYGEECEDLTKPDDVLKLNHCLYSSAFWNYFIKKKRK